MTTATGADMPATIRCGRCPATIRRRVDLPVFGPFMQDTRERSDLFPDVCVACEGDIQADIDKLGDARLALATAERADR